MYDEKTNIKSDEECNQLLLIIFESPIKLLTQFAPNGWKNSEFIKLRHPTPEQQLEEHIRITENLKSLSKNKEKKVEDDKEDVKTLEDFQYDDLNSINELEEFIYILGLTVYDIFSDNHEVRGEDGKEYDLGSFRGSAGFIADFINEHFPISGSCDYMDFYCGSIWVRGRANLFPFYQYIFRKLKENGCNWHYSFPRLGIVDLSGVNPKPENPSEYNPEKALTEEIERKQQVSKLKEELDKMYEDEFEEAKYRSLSPLILAYQDVYGMLPDGHPQKDL